MIIDGINFKELNITKDGELIASITDGRDGIVHKDGYRVQLVVEDVGMSFAEAFKRMKAGAKVKLPSWGGDWFWDAEKQSIMMQCRPKDTDKGQGDLLERKGWNGKNQYIQLATGISYKAADGEVVNCDHESIGNKAIAFVGTSGVQMGWLASQADMLAEDWMFFE